MYTDQDLQQFHNMFLIRTPLNNISTYDCRFFCGYDEDYVVKKCMTLYKRDILNSDGIEDESIGIEYLKKWSPGLTWVGTGASVGYQRFEAMEGSVYNPVTDELEPPDIEPNMYFDTNINQILPIEPYPITNYKTVWRPYRADWQIIDHE